MKNLISLLGLLLLILIACSKDKGDDNLTQDTLFQMIASVSWKIDVFTEGNDSRASEFESYTFTFLTSNHVNAKNEINTYEGNWYVVKDDNADSPDGLTFHIEYTAPENFTGLTGDWGVISATQEMIRLKQTNTDESIDYLTFSMK